LGRGRQRFEPWGTAWEGGRHSGVNINVETTRSEVLEIIDFVIGERNRLEFDL